MLFTLFSGLKHPRPDVSRAAGSLAVWLLTIAFGTNLCGCAPRRPVERCVLVYVDVSGSMKSLPGEETDKLKHLLARALDADLGRSSVTLCLFSNEASTARLKKLYEGRLTGMHPLIRLLDENAYDPHAQTRRDSAPQQGTSYSTVLRDLSARCESADVPTYAVILSDGGVSSEDWSKTEAAASDLAKQGKCRGLLIAPIVDGTCRQILERKLLTTLGERLYVCGYGDATDTIRRFTDAERHH